jgi:hypothetical protein
LTPLGPSEICARSRPLVVLAIAALRLGAGFCLALPLQSLVAASGVGLRVEGDRALFEGGAYLLLEVLRLKGPELVALAYGLFPLFALALLLGVAGNAALLVALNLGGRLRLDAWLTRALRRMPGLWVLSVGTGLGQLVLFLLGGALAGAVPESMSKPLATSAGQVAVWLACAGSAGALGGFSDVAKACFVRHEGGIVSALRQAGSCLSRRPLPTCFGWLHYALVLGLGLLAAAKVTEMLDVSKPGSLRVVAVLAVHQLVVLSAVALRASWFSRALRLAASAR